MTFTPMAIAGAWVHKPKIWPDERGTFHEVFKASSIGTFVDFKVAQVNQSVSRRGVLRGLHWVDLPVGQAKYVSCVNGEVIDFIVDVRPNSKTFLEWCWVRLNSISHNSVFLEPGLAHGFLALTDGAVVSYLCSSEFGDAPERGVDFFDSRIGISEEWLKDTFGLDEVIRSEKDAAALTISDLENLNLLPNPQS